MTQRTVPFLIGIAGGSGSGKTTVATEIIDAVGRADVAVVELDRYYRNRTDLQFDERCLVNYDHPDAFEWPLLLEHLNALRAGDTIDAPVYDYADHSRSAETTTIQPTPVVVVDGILTLYEPSLRELFDLRVFVDVDADLRFIRRMERDIAERGRTAESVVEQYLATVRPMHMTFVEPTKRYADVIIPNGGRNPAVQVLMSALMREKAGRAIPMTGPEPELAAVRRGIARSG